MFTKSESAHLLEGLELLSAQKARFGRTQPQFAPIAISLQLEYDAIRLKLRSAPDETSIGQKK